MNCGVFLISHIKFFQGEWYKKGSQKKNVKCLCRNGQNGDPEWKKSCSWSFNDTPWSVSDVKGIQCKAKTSLSAEKEDNLTDSYTFIIPEPLPVFEENGAYKQYPPGYIPNPIWHYFLALSIDGKWIRETLEIGESIQVSGSCNPNFEVRGFFPCEELASMPDNMADNTCGWPAFRLFEQGSLNSDGILETILQCPRCGCGSEGAINLNDRYAVELAGSRKVTNFPSVMWNQSD